MARKRQAGEKGIAITPTGFRASIRINGRLHQKRFKRSTPLTTIKQWLLSREMKYRTRAPARGTGTFRDDAIAYLAAVAAMPTFTQRQQHINEWVALFGEQSRDTIAAAQIRAQLHAWRAKGMAAGSVNKRRTALMHLFTVLDGRSGSNPVKDTDSFQEPAPAPKALPYAWIEKIFKAMPESRSKARLLVLAYTGIPHAQIATIGEVDVDFKSGAVAVAGRKKGKGTPARIVPLTKQGIAAFRMMQRLHAWGPHPDKTAMRKAFKRACRRALGRDDFRPYDLRHSFGTEVYRSSGDIRATQILMGHSTERLTHRYTLGAIQPRIAAAVKGFGKTR